MLNKVIVVASLSLLFFSCGNGENTVKIGKSYYPSGKIKQVYKYLNDNDTCLFDTFYTYYENGVLEAKIVYDSFGRMNGIAYVYYPSGGLKSSITYLKNLAQGEQIRYDSLGNLIYKGYNFNNQYVGDKYFYRNNKVWTYQFFDFRQNLVNSIEYDEGGKIIGNKRDVKNRPFVDSVAIEKLPNHFYLYKISILQSNPLRTTSKLVTNYYDKDGKLLDHDSINTTGIPLIQFKKNFNSDVAKVDFYDTQYDSILKRPFVWEDILLVDVKKIKPSH